MPQRTGGRVGRTGEKLDFERENMEWENGNFLFVSDVWLCCWVVSFRHLLSQFNKVNAVVLFLIWFLLGFRTEKSEEGRTLKGTFFLQPYFVSGVNSISLCIT